MAAMAAANTLAPGAASAASMATNQDNPATSSTGITQSGDVAAFYGHNSAATGNGRMGLLGRVGPGTPTILDGVGVYGFSATGEYIGLLGESRGSALGRGVLGRTDAGTGVMGVATGTTGSAVVGNATGANTRGVIGQASGANGIGLVGIATGTALALKVQGASEFTGVADFRSAVTASSLSGPSGGALVLGGTGTGTVRKGKSRVTITNPLCTSVSTVLVTLQTVTGGAAILGVKPANGSLTVALSGNATAATKFAYLILA